MAYSQAIFASLKVLQVCGDHSVLENSRRDRSDVSLGYRGNPMKLTILSLLLIVAVGHSQDSSPIREVPFNEEFTVKIGEQVVVKPGIPGNNVKITFVSVPRDGRCPEGAACIVPGNAKVELKFKSSGNRSLSTIVNTDETPHDVEIPGIRVHLIRLDPPRKVGVEIDPNDYEATLVVSRTVFLRDPNQ